MDQLKQISRQLDRLLARKESVIIAIEGSCASGKTTLASRLAQKYDCNVFHMDDFFLRPEQRNPGRFAEAGGNVDYERFQDEVLLPLRAGGDFSYRPFNCQTFTCGEPVAVTAKALNIVEGTYSLHPYFGEPYDLKILLTVEPEVQHRRILERPAFLRHRFFLEWIPMENRYFDHFQISGKADLIL